MESPKIKNSESCSLLSTCKILIETNEGCFCSYCYEVCKKGELSNNKVIYDADKDAKLQCKCSHKGIFIRNFL